MKKRIIAQILAVTCVAALGEPATAAENCSAPTLDLLPYLAEKTSCVNDTHFQGAFEASKRRLQSAIPCNAVEYIDGFADTFGAVGPIDPTHSILSSNHFKIYKNWLGEQDRFSGDFAPGDFYSLESEVANPILATAHVVAIRRLIAEAKKSIFIDIFLFGGTMGQAIASDLLEAADRGVKVIVLHDTKSVFNVGNEIRPLWRQLVAVASHHPNLAALDSNLSPRGRPSSVPFGLERLIKTFAKNRHSDLNLEGYSDHSKILIVDAIFATSASEYEASLAPKVLISSKNWVDSAAANYHDESVIVTGPAAIAAQLSYLDDLRYAFEQNQADGAPIAADSVWLVADTIDKLTSLKTLARLDVRAFGEIGIEPIEANVDGSVRNLDVGIIRKIAAARSTIDLYGKLAYSDAFAKALGDAVRRGVQVRAILDQKTDTQMNHLLPKLVSRYAGIAEDQLQFFWHLPFRPALSFASGDRRTDLFQEIHAKTIVIDGRHSLFGSVNFDSLTWSGGFREFSAWVDSTKIAAKATRVFEAFLAEPRLTVAHRTWLGHQPPSSITLQYFESLQSELAEMANCEDDPKSCDLSLILSGGKRQSPVQKLTFKTFEGLMQLEAARVKRVYPRHLQACR